MRQISKHFVLIFTLILCTLLFSAPAMADTFNSRPVTSGGKSHFTVNWNSNVSDAQAPVYNKELASYYTRALTDLKLKNPGKSDVELRTQMRILGYAYFISDNLEQTATAYEKKSFFIPSKPLCVYIVPGKVDAMYVPLYLDTAAAGMSIGSEYAFGELKHDIGHEMFHWLQNGSYTMYEMRDSRWLMDMTADYAYKAMVNPADSYAGQMIRQNFFKSALTSDTGDADRHKYHAAKLLEEIATTTSNFNFRLFWMDLVTGPRADALTCLENAASNRGGKGLLTYYRNFAGKMLFSPSSPVYFQGAQESDALLRDPSVNGLARYQEFNMNGNSISTDLSVGGEYTAEIWCVKTLFNDQQKKTKLLRLETQEVMGTQTALDVYKTNTLYTNAVKVGEIASGSKSLMVSVSNKDRLYVVASNGQRQPYTFKLKMSDADLALTVNPTQTQDLQVGVPLIERVEVKSSTDEPMNLKLTYDFGDGYTVDGSAVLYQGWASHSKSHAYAKLGHYNGKVTLYAQKGGTPLAQQPFTVDVTKKAPETAAINKPSTPATSPAPAPGKAEYGWVLIETKEFNKLPANETKYTVAGGSGSYVMKYNAGGCYEANCPGEDFTATFTWTAPPSIIREKDTVKMTLGLALANNMHHYSFSGSMNAFFDNIDIDPGFWGGGGPGLVDAAGKGEIGFNKNTASSSLSKNVSAQLGKGSLGSKKELLVSLYNGRSAGTKYIYEWKKIN